jgi:hypothetical protein
MDENTKNVFENLKSGKESYSTSLQSPSLLGRKEWRRKKRGLALNDS